MNKYTKVLMGWIVCLIFSSSVQAEPIYHEKHYPNGSGPFPAVIALHTSGGYITVRKAVKGFLRAGYAVYTPDFFKRHGISKKNRFQTWTKYRLAIEKELIEIVELATLCFLLKNKCKMSLQHPNHK